MASQLMQMGRTISNLDKSTANLNKLAEGGLKAFESAEAAVRKMVADIPTFVAIVILVVLVGNFFIRIDTDLLYPALVNAMPGTGTPTVVNTRGFLAALIQLIILLPPLILFIYFRMRRR